MIRWMAVYEYQFKSSAVFLGEKYNAIFFISDHEKGLDTI
jgi:hypothetical protein